MIVDVPDTGMGTNRASSSPNVDQNLPGRGVDCNRTHVAQTAPGTANDRFGFGVALDGPIENQEFGVLSLELVAPCLSATQPESESALHDSLPYGLYLGNSLPIFPRSMARSSSALNTPHSCSPRTWFSIEWIG